MEELLHRQRGSFNLAGNCARRLKRGKEGGNLGLLNEPRGNFGTDESSGTGSNSSGLTRPPFHFYTKAMDSVIFLKLPLAVSASCVKHVPRARKDVSTSSDRDAPQLPVSCWAFSCTRLKATSHDKGNSMLNVDVVYQDQAHKTSSAPSFCFAFFRSPSYEHHLSACLPGHRSRVGRRTSNRSPLRQA